MNFIIFLDFDGCIVHAGQKNYRDIDPDCDKIAAWRSPVPGGVGPMTVAMLLKNLIDKS